MSATEHVAELRHQLALAQETADEYAAEARREHERALKLVELLQIAVDKCSDGDEVWLDRNWVKRALDAIATPEGR